MMATTAAGARRRVRTGAIVAAAAAVAFAVLGTGGAAESQVAPPVVTASASDGTLTTIGNCSGTATTELEPATVSVSRTGDTTDLLHVALAWSGSIDASVYGAPEGLVIPAGETTATFEIDSAEMTGTVSIEIGPSSDPDAPYDVGDPNTATARVLGLITDPVCATAAPSSTTTSPPTSPPPAAQPVAADPTYTG